MVRIPGICVLEWEERDVINLMDAELHVIPDGVMSIKAIGRNRYKM